MKRLFFLSFMLTLVATASAAGRYSSDDSDWATFIAVVTIAAAVLQIILFFKIWGMTNDIKALKKDHFCETQFDGKVELARYLRKNLVLGNMDTVKRILLQNFIDEVENAYNNMPSGGFEKDEKGVEKWVEYKEQNLKEPIAPYVKNLMNQYAKIGEEVPVYITRMETFNDYFDLFVASDLKVQDEKDVRDSKQE